MNKELQLCGEANYETVALIAKAVSGMYHLTALPAVDIDMVELAVVEIGNNAVEHAYEERAGHQLWAGFKCNDNRVTITISDCGSSMPKEIVEELQQRDIPELDPDDPSTWNTSGRGFGIINQVMDEVLYYQEDGKNHFRMIKHVTP
ncbi:ATP-binding protein [Ferrimonas senticii]|uniref:ATP-binding protein n=1 Tax=Ferrimonas senticii TaxID=394566 RepID=UPI00042716E8|nr:ATP-binding protein [Ferrimonas senticii]